MRVLYLTEESIAFDDALVRGGAIHVRNVVRGLRDRGHEVALVDWNTDDTEPFQSSVHPPTRFFAGAALTYRRAVAVGRQMDADVVVSKTRKTYLAGLLAARRLGVPHVVHVGVTLTPPDDELVDRVDGLLFRLRLRVPHDGYLVVCEYVGDQLRALGVSDDRIHNVRNAVDTDAFGPATPSSLPASVADALPDGPLVGFVGGLHGYKGVHDLRRAVECAEADVSLVFAGDGPERDALAVELSDRHALLGAVQYRHVPALYRALDAVVLPSHTEGLPRVVLEAQASETPVVATAVGGVPEVIEHGETGLLCPPREPPTLADHIDTLFSDVDLRRHIVRRGREQITEGFGWAALYDRYETALTSTVRSP